jgi:NADH-quinone oxidoreductase subunit E
MTSPSLVQDTQALLERETAMQERLNEILFSYQGKEEELIPILQQVQQAFGYLPELAIKRTAEFTNLPESTVFGVSTFYAQFKLVRSGRNIVRVCRGTACHVRGGARVLKEVGRHLGIKPEETSPDFEYSLETVACLGACALAPNIVVNGKVYGRLTESKVRKILAGIKET